MQLDITAIDAAADRETFSGVVTVHRGTEFTFSRCYGWAHRAHRIRTTPETRFAVASGSKMFTALAVMRLIEDGALSLDTRVRDVLGDDLPLIDDAVTVEQLLTHTSGIGDYLDEEAEWEATDYVLTAPVHTLTSAESFLPLLAGFPQSFAPGERFAYCNGGYIVLAIVLERTAREGYHDLVDRLVLAAAGLAHTVNPRTDELPADVATGYLFATGDRVNTLHLPVRGNGDGGAILSASELHAFWSALFAGRIVRPDTLAEMTRPRVYVEDEDMRYGAGLWLHREHTAVIAEGYDAGVSFRSTHIPELHTTVSVFGNTSEGAWPVIGVVAEAIDAALA